MKYFRQTFNISYTTLSVPNFRQTNETVSSAQCSSDDDVEISALLVPQFNAYSTGSVIINLVGSYSVCVLHQCSGGCLVVRAAV